MDPLSSMGNTASLPMTAVDYKHYEYGSAGEGWVRPLGTNRDAVVFVHGFTGDYHGTWTWASGGFFFRKRPKDKLAWRLANVRNGYLLRLLLLRP